MAREIQGLASATGIIVAAASDKNPGQSVRKRPVHIRRFECPHPQFVQTLILRWTLDLFQGKQQQLQQAGEETGAR